MRRFVVLSFSAGLIAALSSFSPSPPSSFRAQVSSFHKLLTDPPPSPYSFPFQKKCTTFFSDSHNDYEVIGGYNLRNNTTSLEINVRTSKREYLSLYDGNILESSSHCDGELDRVVVSGLEKDPSFYQSQYEAAVYFFMSTSFYSAANQR